MVEKETLEAGFSISKSDITNGKKNYERIFSTVFPGITEPDSSQLQDRLCDESVLDQRLLNKAVQP
jgi:hypothetical protein